MDRVALPTQVPSLPRLGFFPGSTIGNLDPAEALHFLERARGALGHDSWFLVGVDLRKDPAILLPAYDDAQGVTAAFNLNLLVRLNREAGADFDLSAFAHRAVWNDAGEPDRDAPGQPARPDGSVSPARRSTSPSGETIHTENSYKYAPEHFAALAEKAGWHGGTVDAIRRGCSHCICWSPDAGPEARAFLHYAASAMCSPVR